MTNRKYKSVFSHSGVLQIRSLPSTQWKKDNGLIKTATPKTTKQTLIYAMIFNIATRTVTLFVSWWLKKCIEIRWFPKFWFFIRITSSWGGDSGLYQAAQMEQLRIFTSARFFLGGDNFVLKGYEYYPHWGGRSSTLESSKKSACGIERKDSVYCFTQHVYNKY